MEPSQVPALEVVVESNHRTIPEFKIGANDDWFIEWKEFSDRGMLIAKMRFDMGYATINDGEESNIYDDNGKMDPLRIQS